MGCITLEVNMLLNCTITILQLLVSQYEDNKIDLMTFIENTRLKVQFLNDHLECIKNHEEKSIAIKLIKKCKQ